MKMYIHCFDEIMNTAPDRCAEIVAVLQQGLIQRIVAAQLHLN